MMGTRGTPPQQADALDVISEWMELMKGAGKTLPAAVAQYKAAKQDAEAMLERLDTVRSELARDRTGQQEKAAELDRRERQVVAKEAAIDMVRGTVKAGGEALARATAENDQLRTELAEKLAGIDGQRKAAQDEIRKATEAANDRIKAGLAEVESERFAARADAEAQQRAAAEAIQAVRVRAESEISARVALVAERESRVIAREAAARKHAAELAALAQE